MHDTVLGWLAAWAWSPRSGVRRRHAGYPACTRATVHDRPWLFWPSCGLAAACSERVEPLLLLAQPGGATAGPAVLPHCRPTLHRDAAAAGADASSSCPCLPLHLYATAGLVRCRLCHAHVAGLVVALSLMALWRAGHVGRKRARLSASVWMWVSTVTPTTSSQGAHTLSH